MGTFANSEDPDEMQHIAAFRQGLHCLLKQKRSSDKYNIFFRERSGSVVECLTQDQGAAGLSLTDVTVLWSLSKIHLS